MAYSSAPIPYLGYRDAKAAIDFLERAFGFEKVGGYEDDNGIVQHAELRCGNGFIMMGTDPEARPPSSGHGVYVVVDDVDAHHARAVEAGAEVVWAPEDTPFGTRRWRGKDPEGNEWSFGSYAPGSSWG